MSTRQDAITKTPGGPLRHSRVQRTITATITAIDMEGAFDHVRSVLITGSHSSRVQDINALKQVKVGDKIDITWTETLLVGFTPDEKK